jgi:kinesin family protein C1
VWQISLAPGRPGSGVLQCEPLRGCESRDTGTLPAAFASRPVRTTMDVQAQRPPLLEVKRNVELKTSLVKFSSRVPRQQAGSREVLTRWRMPWSP